MHLPETDAVEIVRRGERAKAILEDEVFEQIIEELETEYIEAWRTSHTDNRDDRELTFQALRQLDVLKARLGALVDAADLERDRVQRADRRRSVA